MSAFVGDVFLSEDLDLNLGRLHYCAPTDTEATCSRLNGKPSAGHLTSHICEFLQGRNFEADNFNALAELEAFILSA